MYRNTSVKDKIIAKKSTPEEKITFQQDRRSSYGQRLKEGNGVLILEEKVFVCDSTRSAHLGDRRLTQREQNERLGIKKEKSKKKKVSKIGVDHK